jgi:hypothetical protein
MVIQLILRNAKTRKGSELNIRHKHYIFMEGKKGSRNLNVVGLDVFRASSH